jgi:hypothetical protein
MGIVTIEYICPECGEYFNDKADRLQLELLIGSTYEPIKMCPECREDLGLEPVTEYDTEKDYEDEE